MAVQMQAPELQDIRTAQQRIADHVHCTPVYSSWQLDRISGVQCLFKCENLQRAGAFKARGATNAVLLLDSAEAAAGVATHSSGNHGAALAMAAGRRGIAAHIVMPENAPAVKRAAVADYGATIIDCESTLASRESTLQQVVQRTGASVIHPFHDPRVIAGQGTVALEILAQVDPPPDVVLVPVGGGGLLAGVAIAVKSINPNIEVVAAEPAGADDAFRSFGLGQLQPQTSPDTIADGLRTGLGQLNFEIIQRHVDTIVTVPDSTIIRAMQLQWTRMKSVVEPSGAVTFAAILEHPERFTGRRVVAIISGGNVDLERLPWQGPAAGGPDRARPA